jgi:hypothetical protein
LLDPLCRKKAANGNAAGAQRWPILGRAADLSPLSGVGAEVRFRVGQVSFFTRSGPRKKSAFALLIFNRALPAFAQTMSAESKSSETPARPHPAVTALMPQPRSIDFGDGWLPVKGGFQVEWLGYRNALLDRASSRKEKPMRRVM